MSDAPQDMPGWFYGVLIAAIGSLSAGVVKLFYMIRGDSSERIESLKKEVVDQRSKIEDLRTEARACHEDRLEIWKALARINGGAVPAGAGEPRANLPTTQ